ncbi:MAG: DUF108 domain-containing protein, partial [Thaumarchaeota archaeon]|nr:DUF108 domain-containing protein [Nitrososphaerota archaeon]
MRRVALLGCGAIGSRIARAIDSGEVPARLTHAYDANPAAAERLASSLSAPPAIAENAHMLSSHPVDIVVEAASQEAVRDCALSVIQNRRDLLVMSAGALMDGAVLEVLSDACAEFGRSIYLPSGAIAGLDALRAARGELESVTLTTTKHPDSLRGAPGAASLPPSGAAEIFSGSALDAVAMFPQNVNVAAILSLATLGPRRTRVRVVADWGARSNSHTIEARGAFGSMEISVSNVPAPSNPRTSPLAAPPPLGPPPRVCPAGGA